MKHMRGFTLLELMIVIIIVGVLASVAYPNYMDYMQNSKLAEARANLSAMRVKMEQYFQDQRTYVGACAAGTVAPLPADDLFTYECDDLSASTYTVRARGVDAKGTGAFTFTITQANARGSTYTVGGTPTSYTCWIKNKNGTCS